MVFNYFTGCTIIRKNNQGQCIKSEEFFLRLNTDFKLQLSLKDVSNRIYTVILKGDDFYRQKNCWCLKNE